MNPDKYIKLNESKQPFLHDASHSLNLSISDVDEPLDHDVVHHPHHNHSSDDDKEVEHSESGAKTDNTPPLVNTFTSQVKALLIKNVTLQSKQKGTNLCQLITPILCLFLLLIVKNLVDAKLKAIFDFQMDFPYVFNVPYKRLYNNSLTPIKINDCLQWYLYDFEGASNDTKKYVYDNETKTGLLKNVYSQTGNSHKFYYCRDCGKEVPYFELPHNGTINQQIFESIKYLNELSFTTNEDSPGSYLIPDGAVTFYEANQKNLSFRLQINDINFPEYHRGNGVSKFYFVDPNSGSASATIRTPDAELSMIDMISRSYIQTVNPNIVIMSGSQYMTMPGFETNVLLRLLSTAETCLYPIALSLLLAVFMYTLVLEKEERLREMMKMNGLKMTNYWVANYIWNMVLYLPSAAIFLLFGMFVVKMPFFTETEIGVLILMLVGWGFSQASLSFFFQNFFAKARMVTVIGYMLSIWTTIFCVALNVAVFAEPQNLPIMLNIYPPIAFCRLIYDLCTKCANNKCISSFGSMNAEMWICLVSLYLGAIVFLVLGLYLEQVLPQEYGVPKHPLFFLKGLFGSKEAKKSVEKPSEKEPSLSISQNKATSIFNLGKVDEDVREERTFVANLREPYRDYPLVIKNLRKVYPSLGGKPAKVAVKDMCFHVSKGEMFGLLGPNGAGKTSLISMLTGLYTPESGNAWVAGYDIVNQIDLVRTKMGVCPQFDLLWPELTVRDHLLFYARMRGIPKSEEEAFVAKAIEEVQLQKSTDFATKNLSGGMKRRLSVAIALVGEPKIVFLDEPTTGLDPENRRQLWDILAESRGKKAMVLTTHLMEEADVLCNRIGIVTKGQLRCIGKQARLKTKYGSGYHLLINCQTDGGINGGAQSFSEIATQKILNFIHDLLPQAHLKTAFNGSFVFEVPLQGLSISKIFEKLEEHKEELGISDWGVSQSTLEDVFMEVVDLADQSPTLKTKEFKF